MPLRFRLILAFWLILISAAFASAAEKAPPIKLLTIGHSLTRDATEYLGDLLRISGRDLVLKRANLGASGLERHARHLAAWEASREDPEGRPYRDRDNPEAPSFSLVDALQTERWDFVTVTQNSADSFKAETYEPHGERLIEAIRKHAPSAKILVFQTPAYREDHAFFADGQLTQRKMYEGLRAAFDEFARRHRLPVVPVGDAFQIARSKPPWRFVHPDPNFDYRNPTPGCLPAQAGSLNVGWYWKKDPKGGPPSLQTDANHANVAGRYLGACVFYELLTGASVLKIAWHPEGLNAEQASSLRQAAHEAVAARKHAAAGANKSALSDPRYLSITGSAWRLALGDVDGDGRRDLICGLYQGAISCVDPVTGRTRWERPLPGYPFAVAAADVTGDGRAESFAACADGSVQAFGPDGTALWTYAPNHAAKYALAFFPWGDGAPTLVVAGLDRTLHALDPATGAVRTRLDLGFAVQELVPATLERGAPPVLLALRIRDARYGLVRRDGDRLALAGTRALPAHADIMHGYPDRTFQAYTAEAVDLDGDGRDEVVLGSGFTQGGKLLIQEADGATRLLTEPWPGPATAGLERRDTYFMTLVRAWRPTAAPGEPRILAVTTSGLRVFDARGRLLGEASAPVGFTDLAVDGDTLYLGSSPNGDHTIHRLDLTGDWRRDLSTLERQGLARRMGDTLATMLDQARALPAAPSERMPALFHLGRVTHRTGQVSPIVERFRREYPYPQFDILPASDLSNMVRGPRENVRLGPGGEALGPLPGGHPPEDFVDLAREIERSGQSQQYYLSHGCDPRITVATLDAMLAAAPRHLRSFTVHEDEHPERIPAFVGDYLAPLAARASARGAMIFSVQKNVWWFDTPALPGAGPALFRPELASALVAATDDANSRTADLNLMARFGLRQAGLVGHLAACTIQDLHCYTRLVERGYPKHGHPFLRLLVAHTVLGADHFHFRGDNVHQNERFIRAAEEAFAPFLHLLGKGWVFTPRPDQMAGMCPVGVAVHPPPVAWIKDAHNGHRSNDWEADPLLDLAVLPHNGTVWGFTPTPEHALPAVAFRKQRQGGNHVPATPYGPVAFVPAHASLAQVAGVKEWWHTDGVYLWREGGPKLTGPAAATALRASLEAAAERLPFRPRGDDVFFHTLKVAEGHYRIFAIDSGWLDPADRRVTVAIQLPGEFVIRDTLRGESVPVAGRQFDLAVPAGALRMLEATVQR